MPYTEVTTYKIRMKTMNLNELFIQLEEELKRGNYTREEKTAIINYVGDMYKNQIDDELKKDKLSNLSLFVVTD